MHRRGSMFTLSLIIAVLALSSAQTSTSAPNATTSLTATTTTAAPVPSTAEPVPSTAEPVPSTAEPVTSTAEPVTSTAEPVTSTAEPVASTTEPVATTVQPASIATPASTTAAPPAPCSSEAFSLLGKCGDSKHGYLRCPNGYWCSKWGYCGVSKEYRSDALCPREQREDPAVNATKLGFSSDDKPEDYLVQDDLEAEAYDKQKTWKNCQTSHFHRWGKCGTTAHGNFRCKYGEWCTKWGYCSKYAGAAKDALCPREPRRHPKDIKYVPAPDDDPFYAEVLPTTRSKRFRTTKPKNKI